MSEFNRFSSPAQTRRPWAPEVTRRVSGKGPKGRKERGTHFTALSPPRPKGKLWDSQVCWPPAGSPVLLQPCFTYEVEQTSVAAWVDSENTDQANGEATWSAWARAHVYGMNSYPSKPLGVMRLHFFHCFFLCYKESLPFGHLLKLTAGRSCISVLL